MPGDKLRVGVIGANVSRGWGSSAHIPALKALPEYELTAVCTAHQETAEAAAAKFGAKLAFHDYREMISHPDIDLVAVVVRVPYHYQLTMEVLKAKKPVYTEWPLGATLEEAREMAALASANGVRTMVGLQARGSPGYQYLKELIDEGYVGEVLACHLSGFSGSGLERTSDRLWTKDRSAGVGPLTIAFGHSIDALCYCVGGFSEVTGVVATQVPQWQVKDQGTTVDVTTPDNVLVSGRLANGAVVSAHVGAIPWHGSELTLQIFGREGTLVYHGAQTVRGRLEGARGTDSALQELAIPSRLSWVPKGTPDGSPFNVAQMYRRFGEALTKDQPVEPNFDTAVQLHTLLNAIQTASDQGKRVQIP